MLSSYFASIVCSSIISTTLICSVLSSGSSSAESLPTSRQWFHFKDLPPLQPSWIRTHLHQYHQRYQGRSLSQRSALFLFSLGSHKSARKRKSHHDHETIIEVMEEFLDHYNEGDYHRLEYDGTLSKELNDIVPPFGFSKEYYDQVRRRRGHRGNDATTATSTFVAARSSRGSSWIRRRGKERPVATLFGTPRINKQTWEETHGPSSNPDSGRTNSKPKSRVARKSRARSGCCKGPGNGLQKRRPTSSLGGPGRMKRQLFRETEDYDYGFDRMTQRKESERKDGRKLYLRHRKELHWSEGDNLRDYGNVGGRAPFFISGQRYVSEDKEPTGTRVSNMAESMIRRGDGNGQSYLPPVVAHLGSDSAISSRERLLKTLQPRDGFVYLKRTKSPTSSPSMSAMPAARLRKELRRPRLPLRALTLKE